MTDGVTGETVCTTCGVVVESDTHVVTQAVTKDGMITGGILRNGQSTAPVEKMSNLKFADKISKNKPQITDKITPIINSVCAKLGLPASVKMSAASIMSKQKGLIKNRTYVDSSAAILYMSCRMLGITRTMNEVCESANSNIKNCRKIYNRMCLVGEFSPPPPDPTGFVTRFASDLGLPEKIVRKALKILKEFRECSLVDGKSPAVLAAYSVYAASRTMEDRPTQFKMAITAKVTEVSIRNMHHIYKTVVSKNET